MNPKLKNGLDTLLRMGFCMIWLVSAVLMISNFAAYQADTSDVALAWRASGYALIVIGALLAHAHLVDKKTKEGANG